MKVKKMADKVVRVGSGGDIRVRIIMRAGYGIELSPKTKRLAILVDGSKH